MPELTDRVLQRRFQQNLMGLEALGADENIAQLASSVILHLEKHSRVRVEQHETLALVGLLNVLAKNLAERAGGMACYEGEGGR